MKTILLLYRRKKTLILNLIASSLGSLLTITFLGTGKVKLNNICATFGSFGLKGVATNLATLFIFIILMYGMLSFGVSAFLAEVSTRASSQRSLDKLTGALKVIALYTFAILIGELVFQIGVGCLHPIVK